MAALHPWTFDSDACLNLQCMADCWYAAAKRSFNRSVQVAPHSAQGVRVRSAAGANKDRDEKPCGQGKQARCAASRQTPLTDGATSAWHGKGGAQRNLPQQRSESPLPVLCMRCSNSEVLTCAAASITRITRSRYRRTTQSHALVAAGGCHCTSAGLASPLPVPPHLTAGRCRAPPWPARPRPAPVHPAAADAAGSATYLSLPHAGGQPPPPDPHG